MQNSIASTTTAYLASSANNLRGNAAQTTEGFGFADLIDIVNPLQHIPIVSNIYRGITGDTIGSFANIVGSTLFGGPIGGGLALANEIIQGGSGKSAAEHVASAFTGDSNGDEGRVHLASLNEIEPESGDSNFNNGSRKIRATTEDWLNPNFGRNSQTNSYIEV